MAFIPIEQLNRLYDGYQKAFKIAGWDLLLLQQGGVPIIIENRCPHMDAPLTFAEQVAGGLLRCRAHGIAFSLSTGKACGPLANTIDCLKKFPVVYDGNQLGIDPEAGD